MTEEERLQAWLDGELPEAEAAAMAAAVAADPALQARAGRLAALDRALVGAFEPPLEEPLPPALVARVEATLAGGLRRLPDRGSAARPRPRIQRQWTALAAGIALLLAALPAVWLWAERATEERLAAAAAGQALQRELARAAEVAALEQALSQALETQVSGQAVAWAGPASTGAGGRAELLPVSTFRSQSGQWCREYRIAGSLGGAPYEEHGVACRRAGGGWERRVLLLDPADGAGGGAPAESFAPQPETPPPATPRGGEGGDPDPAPT